MTAPVGAPAVGQADQQPDVVAARDERGAVLDRLIERWHYSMTAQGRRPWRWHRGDGTVEMAGIEPATATPQGAPATLAVTPADRLRHHLPRPAVFMVLTLWTCQLSSLHERLFGTVNSAGIKTRPGGAFPLGRLRASACSRLPGNHCAGQGSQKPRRRIHVSGPLRRLARGHVSMVSR